MFWTYFGAIFPKLFLPSVPWGIETSKNFRKIIQPCKIKQPTKCYVKRLNENLYLENIQKSIVIILSFHLQNKWFRVYSMIEYNSFRMKVWWTSFSLFVRAEWMLDSSGASISWLHICFLVQYAPVLFQGSSTRFLQRSFVESLATELDFACALIEAAIGFTAQTNHFSATKFLFK